MSEKTMNARVIQKHDVEVNWNKATNFIPKKGEIIVYDKDSNYNYERIKVGDGTTVVSALPFITDKLTHARAIKLTGDVNDVSQNFDGSDDISLNVVVKDDSHNHVIANVDGLQDALDNKANASHTHNYAGSSTPGGAANSANKLNTNAGNPKQPIYFSNGVPIASDATVGSATQPVFLNKGTITAGSYTLGKSVPSDAVFTDTNTWRGIQNSLTSDSASDSLSAAMGKRLNEEKMSVNGGRFNDTVKFNEDDGTCINYDVGFFINEEGGSTLLGSDRSLQTTWIGTPNTSMKLRGAAARPTYNDSEVALKSDADSKYTKPSGGIPTSDLTSAAQDSLSKANSAVQPATLNSYALKTSIPSVGNGTITITQNGTSKGSFTLNQSGNATIALSDTNTDTNTTYSMSQSGSKITLGGSNGSSNTASTSFIDVLSADPTSPAVGYMWIVST